MTKRLLVFLAAIFLLALAPADNQYFRFQNVLTNPGFENLKAGWTAAGSGSFTITQTAANVGSGISSASFDAAAASDTLTSSQVTIPSGLYGQSCRADFLQKGGDSNLTAKVIDGSLSNVATLALSARTNYTLISLDFTCPTSGTFAFQILAGANAAVVYIDQVYIGLASAITTANIVDATIVNADISASAAIAGTKVDAATSSTRGAVNNQDNGSFTATFTQTGGYSQAVTVTYRRVNNIVTLNIPSFVGTTTAAEVIQTATSTIPSGLRPASLNIATAVQVRNNGATQDTAGWMFASTNGRLELDRSAATTAFTSGASGGLLQAASITYNLD